MAGAPPRSGIRAWGLAAAVLVLALVPFLPALEAGFVNWDDPANVVENERWRGFSAEHLRWMFGTSFFGHWQPLTWLSYAVDHALWGLEPRGFHLTNLLLHALGAALFLGVVLEVLARVRSAGRDGGPDAAHGPEGRTRLALCAAAGALFFAVHPLRVESVAWVTERRDVLSGVFWLGTVLAYLRAHRPGGPGRRRALLGLSLLLFALSLLSKAWGITLPLVLLLLDVLPLRRLRAGQPAGERARVLLEKLPWALLAGGAALAAVRAQGEVDAAVGLEAHGVAARVAQAVYGLAFYVVRTVLPLGLSPLYPLPPQLGLGEPRILLAGAFVLALTLVLVLWRPARRRLLVPWLVYVVVVSPVLGFLQSGSQMVADRYSYLACLPFAVVLAGALDALAARARPGAPRAALGALVVILLGVYGALAWRQTRAWHDSVSLWTQALEVDPENYVARYNLGNELHLRGETSRAIEQYEAAVRLRPGFGSYHHALGLALREEGHLDAARASLERALANDADTPEVRTLLGGTLVELGRAAEALPHLTRATEQAPASASAQHALALAYRAVGLDEQALAAAERAVGLDAGSALARNLFGALLAAAERYPEALEQCNAALRLAPDLADAHYNLGLVRDLLGEEAAAAEAFREGLRLEPRLRIANRFAWILATHPQAEVRDGAEALRWARWVDERTETKRSRFLATLAAAQAETGDFQGALATIERALAVAGEERASDLLEARELYRARRPLHRTP